MCIKFPELFIVLRHSLLTLTVTILSNVQIR